MEGDRVIGVEAVNLATGAEENYRGPVILATGHSARDVYRYLASSKIEIEAKGIAVGVRLEHPSQLIVKVIVDLAAGECVQDIAPKARAGLFEAVFHLVFFFFTKSKKSHIGFSPTFYSVRPLSRAGVPSYNLSVSPTARQLPLVGEPLAGRAGPAVRLGPIGRKAAGPV